MVITPEPEQHTDAERAVWEALSTGTLVDMSAREEPIRAEVLAGLLRGVRAGEPGPAGGLHLSGARICGVLDLAYATVTIPVRLEDCRFEEAPNLIGAAVRGFTLMRCELPGLHGRLMRVEGDLDLRGTTIRGTLNLIRASVAGEVRLNGAHLVNPGGWALFAGGLVVESAFFGRFTRPPAKPMEEPLRVEGGLRLAGAHLLGGLFLQGVTIRNPGGLAVQAESMTVLGRMLCGDGLVAEGSIELPHARIEGELSFAGARLEDSGVALSLANAVVNDLDLRTAQPIAGLVNLRHLRCGVVRDSPDSWPARLALDGMRYDALDDGAHRVGVRQRLQWLRRDPEGYRPQPYEQLAAHYRRLGADADARLVLLNKQRQQRRYLSPPARLFGHLLDWMVGYGYQPWRAAVWLVLMLGAGTAVFSRWPPTPAAPARTFDAVMYTFDLLLPISAFGLRDAFVPVDSTRWVAYALTAAGWLLITALVAGVSRALRRD